MVGRGVFHKDLSLKHSFMLPNVCSVFQAKVVAIKLAVVLLKYMYTNDQRDELSRFSHVRLSVRLSVYSRISLLVFFAHVVFSARSG